MFILIDDIEPSWISFGDEEAKEVEAWLHSEENKWFGLQGGNHIIPLFVMEIPDDLGDDDDICEFVDQILCEGKHGGTEWGFMTNYGRIRKANL